MDLRNCVSRGKCSAEPLAAQLPSARPTNEGDILFVAPQALIWITVLISSAAGASRTPEDTSYLVRETVRAISEQADVHTFHTLLFALQKDE